MPLMWLTRAVFFAVVCTVAACTVLWLVWARRRTRTKERWAVALWALPFLLFIGAFLVWPSGARRAHHVLPMWFISAAYVWLLLVAPLTVAIAFLFWLPRRRKPAVPVEERRGFLRAAALLAPPICTGAATGIALRTMGEFRVRELEVPLRALPEALDGLTIAHVSDLHVGKFTRERDLARAVDAANAMRADLVLHTGDLIDLSLTDLDHALDYAKRLEGRYGHFMCEGNHDRIDDGDEFRRRVKADGTVPLLLNEAATVEIRGEKVQLLGLTWQRGIERNEAAMRELNEQRDPEAFPILLGHHPHVFDLHDDIPLTLAGHTHGGQLNVREGVGVAALLYRYWSGLYERGSQRLVVSNGVGNWFPLRVQAPAELVHLTLRRMSQGPA